MSKKKKFELLTKKEEKALQDMVSGMLDIAADVVKEYDDLDLSDLEAISGSVTQINANSPYLDEVFKGESWKRVIKNMNDRHMNAKGNTKDDASE